MQQKATRTAAGSCLPGALNVPITCGRCTAQPNRKASGFQKPGNIQDAVGSNTWFFYLLDPAEVEIQPSLSTFADLVELCLIVMQLIRKNK